MKLLAFETSSDEGSVALLVDRTVNQKLIPAPRQQTAQLLPLTDRLLAEAGLRLEELDGIAFGRGPGSFTGLRVAAAAAQGLGLATGLPLLPVSSLAATAQGLWRTDHAASILVCVDAHMGEVYWAAYEIRDGLARVVGAEHLTAPEGVTSAGLASWSAAGNGFEVHRGALARLRGRAHGIFPRVRPRAVDLLPQARADLAAGRGRGPEGATPVYLRTESAWKTAVDPA